MPFLRNEIFENLFYDYGINRDDSYLRANEQIKKFKLKTLVKCSLEKPWTKIDSRVPSGSVGVNIIFYSVYSNSLDATFYQKYERIVQIWPLISFEPLWYSWTF